ncbi:MAG TPA: YfiR/HmsC family protein [Geothrix sp.]|nr:YfiR/HmsC family protein [Geothrix sp.]
MKWRSVWLVPVLLGTMVHAEDLAPPTLAKILKLVLTDAKEPSIACSDPLLKFELTKLGVRMDPEARIVWVRTPQEIAKFAGTSRLTICGQVSDLKNGVIVALVGEGGRGVFYINRANATSNKVTIPSALTQLGKVVQ